MLDWTMEREEFKEIRSLIHLIANLGFILLPLLVSVIVTEMVANHCCIYSRDGDNTQLG